MLLLISGSSRTVVRSGWIRSSSFDGWSLLAADANRSIVVNRDLFFMLTLFILSSSGSDL